jgi:hypothetical protein
VHGFPPEEDNWPVSHEAKLYFSDHRNMSLHRHAAATSLFLALAVVVSGCSAERDDAKKRITPEYDKTGKLRLLKYDSKGNGTVDTWSYMDGARVVRIEIDKDGDGKIDRWEYYGPDQKLEKVGSSRLNDGKEDTWSFAGPDGAVARIDVSTHRDGKIDRSEYYEHDVMVRAEEDTDADGKMDKWERYDGTRLESVAFDTSHRGTADRRLTYAPDGTAHLDVDPKGDGTFVPVAAATPKFRASTSR